MIVHNYEKLSPGELQSIQEPIKNTIKRKVAPVRTLLIPTLKYLQEQPQGLTG